MSELATVDSVPRDWTERAAHRFALLSVPARLELVNRLIAHGEQSVQALVSATGLRQANVSKHLGMLAREGLVARRRSGTHVFYRIADPTLAAVCTLICGRIRLEAEAD